MIQSARAPLRARLRGSSRVLVAVSALAIALGALPAASPAPVAAVQPPPRFLGPAAVPTPGVSRALQAPVAGFQDASVITGLAAPTAVRFSPDGRVFVAQKSGRILVYPSLTSTTPSTFVDLGTNVDNFWDRGLLGMTLDPNFPTSPYVYVLYTYDAAIGGTAPRWNDACPTPPGPTTDGCVVSGRLSRLTASGNTTTGGEKVLIEDWCQQFPSHSIGELRFGPDGALYVSAGEGANFNGNDYGQYGGGTGSPTLKNPCGDPPAGVGGTMTPPTAHGGRLRSQSVRRPSGEPVVLSGSILRVDPVTGAGLVNNPLASSSSPNARRIVGYGLRNPFRFTFRPGTSELWIGDVGDQTWEEINRIVNPLAPTVTNFGWPCYEGAAQHGGYAALNLDMCNSLYTNQIGLASPYFAYNHASTVVSGESCPTGSSSITGLAFYTGTAYPTAYRNALFFADHSRNCIWAMKAGTNGLPDPNQIVSFVPGASNPVALEIGPGGDLFYVDHEGGAIHRIAATAPNQPPSAVINATPPAGVAPLHVDFDGTASSDPEGGTLTYSWDLDGNGTFGDSTSPTPSFTYTTVGTYTVGLRVTDPTGGTASTTRTITVDNTWPKPVIDMPLSSLQWAVGDPINFSGHATYGSGAGTAITGTGLVWTLIIHHCPSNCHTHTVQSWTGTSGSFNAPDHDYPSYLELVLTATDPANRTGRTSVRLDPKTVPLTFASSPSGLQLAVGLQGPATTPFTRTVIVNSGQTVSAPTPQVLGTTNYVFTGWSDGGAAAHTIIAPASATTYTATYVATGTTAYLSDLAYTVTANGWGPVEKDRSNGEAAAGDGKPLTLAGVVYAKGLGAHAASDIRYGLSSCSTFTVKVGIDDEVGANGSAIFQIWGDATKLADSGVMTGNSPTQTLTVDLTGRAQLRLVIDPNGSANFDHGDWADAKLTCGSPPPPDTTPPTISSVSPASGATGVAVGSSVTATFSEGLDPTTVSGSTFSLVASGTTTPLAATVSYDGPSKTATLTPSAALLNSTAYTATVKGNPGGVKDVAGNLMTTDFSWSFTTAAGPPPDTTPPTVSSVSPASAATGVAVGSSVTATFSEALDPTTVSGSTFSLVASGTTTPLAATVSYDGPSKTATLNPSAALLNSTAYTATVKGNPGGVKDVAGNLMTTDFSWSFTTAATGTTAYLSDLAYTVTANGWGPVEKDRSNGEAAAGDGKPLTLAGVVYAKGLGAHAASDIRYGLSSCSTFTVKVGIDDEVGANGSAIFQIWGDATKLADSGVMTGNSPTQTLTVDLTGRAQLRLVIDPNGSANFDHGDWADAKLTCGSPPPPDTTPPTISSVSPASGATGVAVGSSVTATFSEGLDPTTVSGSTFSLVASGTTTPLAATVSYDGPSKTATLNPSAALLNSTAYTATVKGNPGGVKDVAGNLMATDFSWSFTTAAGPPPDTTPPTVSSVSPASAATGVAVGSSVTATFSEALDPTTVSGSTFSLVASGTTTPLAATVSYDGPSKTATLNPSAALANSTAYTATVKGNPGGVKDVAGNLMTTDFSWSFTTAATGTTAYLSDLAYTVTANGWGPVEKDRSNGEAAAGDGKPLTLAGVVYTKGLGAHAASDIRYGLSSCSTFTVKVGIDDEVGANGSAIFQIWGDATKLADSGVMTGNSPTQTLTVDLTGRAQLRLVIDPNGSANFDHGDWADAKLTCA